MEKKKGFWNSLLGKKDTDNLPAVLKNEYGIDIMPTEMSLAEIKALGFRHMDKNEVGRFDGILQYVPQIIAGNAYGQNVGQAFNKAVEGSFRAILKPGQHLAASKQLAGAYVGAGLSNKTNQVAGQAVWVKNGASLSVSAAPQIALGIFNALSVVTGQYFMSQINSKMTRLQEGVDRIENFLDSAQRSKLKAACQEMEDIINRSEYILGNPDQRKTAIDQIHAIQRTAQESIDFCQEQIKIEQDSMKKEDKDEDIQKKLNIIGKYLAQYHTSVQLYSIATLLEVQFTEVEDPAEMKAFRQQMEKRVVTYKSDFSQCSMSVNKYLDENHVLNDRTFWQSVATIATGWIPAAIGGLAGFFAGSKLSKKVDELFVDQQKKLKAERVEMADALIGTLADETKIDAPLQILGNMERVKTQDVEIVRVGDEYYTNLPADIITA